jgi:hypothetical protein
MLRRALLASPEGVVVMIRCGSRGLGQQQQEDAPAFGIPSYLPLK